MKTPVLRFALTLVVAFTTAFPLAAADPVSAGMDAAKLKDVPKALQKFVDDQVIAGAVGLVARMGQVVALDVVGYADLATKEPMRADHLFWIASMTKPITATAVLMLQDEGKLSVEDPVEKYLPEFKGQWLIDEATKERVTVKRPARPITLRDLLTHTSGLAAGAPETGRDLSLAELTLAYALQPLQFAPGSKWSYNNPGINTLGRIVEVVSGEKFSDFLDRRLFVPLGMKDTTFWPSEEQAKRVAKSYQPGADGKGLSEVAVFFLRGPLTSRARTAIPAGGLYATAPDLARFYQMILNGGTLDGRRYVSEAGVKLMTRTQTGDLKTGFTEGMSFGFGWQVVRQPVGVTAMLAPGTFGHGGAYATQGWVDPAKEMIFVLMFQRTKLPNSDGSEIRRAFQQAAVDAMKN
jgi:CubicO group peptidase (beta-lactamase class C family)